jgi:hypothetical protein
MARLAWPVVILKLNSSDDFPFRHKWISAPIYL